jgi:hypothetical protein
MARTGTTDSLRLADRRPGGRAWLRINEPRIWGPHSLLPLPPSPFGAASRGRNAGSGISKRVTRCAVACLVRNLEARDMFCPEGRATRRQPISDDFSPPYGTFEMPRCAQFSKLAKRLGTGRDRLWGATIAHGASFSGVGSPCNPRNGCAVLNPTAARGGVIFDHSAQSFQPF